MMVTQMEHSHMGTDNETTKYKFLRKVDIHNFHNDMCYLFLPDCAKVLIKKSVMFRPVRSNNVSVVFWILC